jgi:hypothetical protein
MHRPIGIYASSLSRRQLARRRARCRPPLARAANWVAAGGLVALAGVVVERLAA